MRTTFAALALAALFGAAPALAQNQGDSSQASTPGGGSGSPFSTNGMPSNNAGSNPGGTGTAPVAPSQPATTASPAAPVTPAR